MAKNASQRAAEEERRNNAAISRVRNGGASGGGSSSGRSVYTGSNPYMYAYNHGIKQNINRNYGARSRAATSAREQYLAGQEASRNKWLSEQEGLRTSFLNRAQTENNQSIDNTNAGYDTSAKQNYINYMQAQKNLPSQLNSLGIRGGASESSAIRLGTNYGSNVASNERARNTDLANLRQAYEKLLADYDTEYRQGISSYDDEYRNRINTYEDAYQEKLAQIEADKNSALTSAYTTARENDLQYRKERREQNLEAWKETIEGRYKTKEGYKKLIQRLRNSNDPNKRIKIWYAKQAMNHLDEDGNKGGGGGSSRSYGGGGSYGGGSYGGGGGGGSSSSSVTTNAARTAAGGTGGNYGTTYSYSSNKSGNSSSSSSRRHGGRSNSITNWWRRYTK